MKVNKNYFVTKFPVAYRMLRTLAYPKRWLQKRRENVLITQVVDLQKEALSKLKDKDVIRCVFFALDPTVWKYDYIFQKMMKHTRFDPVVLICPHLGYGDNFTREKSQASYNYFTSKGYPVVLAQNDENNSFLNVREKLFPDIIFFSSPYTVTQDPRYYITSYLDILTIYVPYFFNGNSDQDFSRNNLAHNIVWRYYLESDIHRKLSLKHSRNKGRNTYVSGYPGIEVFLDKTYVPTEKDWKIKGGKLKKIIWGPHHTIVGNGSVQYSCFLQYAEFMVEMAKKYADKVQIVFKPHPLLRPKLSFLWGKERADAYFAQWEDMPNTAYSEGNYVDLFLTSDAIIHDSGSFIAEYLYCNKPAMRTMNDRPLNMYDELAQQCIEHYYKAYNKEDIESFIKMVINGEDPMLEQRTSFVENVLKPKGMPSDNIINDILDSIDNQILYRN